MSFQVIRPQIATLLETLDTIHEVSSSPKIKFSGYPAAHVVPSNNESDYETNVENIRNYAFLIRIFYETKHTGIGDALTALEEVVDSVLDLFDQEDLKSGANRTVGVSLPSGYQYINIWAAPSAWSELPDDQLLMAEITVRVRISRDIS